MADFTRHKWNCLPVMVTEIPGKGRGLVAAKDIKQGEQGVPTLRGTKLQFERLKGPDEIEDGVNVNDEADRNFLAMKKFVINSRMMSSKVYTKCTSLYLNISLFNHSCSPNAVEGYLQPYNEKDFFELCCSLEARRTAIRKSFALTAIVSIVPAPTRRISCWSCPGCTQI